MIGEIPLDLTGLDVETCYFDYRLEEIGAAAAKEYSLEKALEKMKFEWQDVVFEMIPYRETVRNKLNES